VHLSELGAEYSSIFEKIMSEKKKHNFFLSFNPGAVQIDEKASILFDILKVTDLLFVNKLEARIICNAMQAEIPELLDSLSKKIAGHVIITDGKEGAYAYDRRMKYHAPMFPGERVEATGAGDAFSSGVLAALIQKKSLQDALAWGSIDAASAVQFLGPTEGLLTTKGLEASAHEHEDYRVIPM
jgi:sugar/nucleoside kinase (ribokinase family)